MTPGALRNLVVVCLAAAVVALPFVLRREDAVSAWDEGDPVLDIEVTTNRVDCMNVYGVAREVSVLYRRPLKPIPAEVAESGRPAAEELKVVVEAADLCPRFCARVLEVRVGPSPSWIRERLEKVGVRPIDPQRKPDCGHQDTRSCLRWPRSRSLLDQLSGRSQRAWVSARVSSVMFCAGWKKTAPLGKAATGESSSIAKH